MIKGGVVIEITKLKNHVVAVANAIPTSRTYNGNASAEYWESGIVTFFWFVVETC